MEPQEYQRLYELENTHWWYVGLRRLILYFINKYCKSKKGLKILDAGCGTGRLLEELQRHGMPIGIDYSWLALTFCKKRDLSRLLKGSVSHLPFKDGQFDLVTSVDVLYHSAVEDDLKALKEFCRVLKDDGVLIMNLPAYEFLRSQHDDAIHTRRRYTRGEIHGKLKEAGFSANRITYRCSLLFPVIFLIRSFRKPSGSVIGGSDLKETSPLLNKFLFLLLSIENLGIRFINLPFGSSVFCVSNKIIGHKEGFGG